MNIPNTKTPLLDQVDLPEDLRKLEKCAAAPVRRRVAHRPDRHRLRTLAAISAPAWAWSNSPPRCTMCSTRPADRIIWDVGHQAYPHKILTGRRSRMRTLRQGGGLSGFTKRSESEYDPFGAAHSSTLDFRRPGHGGGARPARAAITMSSR